MGRVKRGMAGVLEAVGGLALLKYLARKRPRILMYHRVIDDEPYVNGLRLESFEQQMAYVARNFRVVPVDQLLAEWQASAVEPHTLALTFDDAHLDFYRNIWPKLRAYQLPATLYVPTGFVDGTHWLWPDRLKYILLNTNQFKIDIAGIGELSLAKDCVIETWSELGDYCLQLNDKARTDFIERLAELLGVIVPSPARYPFSSVTWAQLREMKAGGLDVGSHSVTHPIFARQEQTDLRYELEHSAQRIKDELGVIPRGICYPNGRAQDINQQVIDTAREVGYKYGLLACNIANRHKDIFTVPRLDAGCEFWVFKWRLTGIERVVNRAANIPEY